MNANDHSENDLDPWRRLIAMVTAGVLFALSGLHLLWLRSSWPLGSREEFLRTVVGVGSTLSAPSDLSVVLVAALLGAAAWIHLAHVGLVGWRLPRWTLRSGLWVIAGVFLLRGGAGLVPWGAFQVMTPEFAYWNLRIYSPLAATLGLASASLIRSTHTRA